MITGGECLPSILNLIILPFIMNTTLCFTEPCSNHCAVDSDLD